MSNNNEPSDAELAEASRAATDPTAILTTPDAEAWADWLEELSHPAIPLHGLPGFHPDEDPGATADDVIAAALGTTDAGWAKLISDRVFAGGFRPGNAVAIAAPRSGGGKTTFVSQLTVGLAARSEAIVRGIKVDGPETLTPVIWLSEMSARELEVRRAGAITGLGERWIRDPYWKLLGKDARAQARHRAWLTARESLPSCLPGTAFTSYASVGEQLARKVDGHEIATEIYAAAGEIKRRLEDEHGKAVVPIVVLDPIHRLAAANLRADENQALAAIGSIVAAKAEEIGAVTICTLDTNRESSRKDPEEDVSGAQLVARWSRGTQTLDHILTHTIAVRRNVGEGGTTELVAWIGKARGGEEIRDKIAHVWKWKAGRITAP